MHALRRTAVAFGIALALFAGPVGHDVRSARAEAPPPPDGTPDQRDFFEARIRPVLVASCYDCHSNKESDPKGGLRLDSAEALRQGGDSGPAIVPGKPDESLLVAAVRYESLEMPPTGKLNDEVIADLVRWVEMGAPDPRTEEPAASPPTSPDPEAAPPHWAFQRPLPHEAPVVQDAAWPRTKIDRFILARQEAAGVQPAPDADRRTLLRRLSIDLVGLPPTYEEAQAFAADASPAAVEAAVDRLMASPHFGERWARHWLDVARYADTKGYVFQEDRNYPEAHTYRDWVIRALNEDLPYDQFLFRQLAADQLDPPDDAQLPAMGFLTLGRRFINNRHDIIDDRIDVVTRGTMALTVTCARCHDHKYDPIPMADYYSLYGVFASSTEPGGAPSALRMADLPQPVTPRILLRGDAGNPGLEVPRQFLRLVAGESRQPFQHGSGRAEMARAIASADNPLTARVFVNRVWGHLFGRGIVDTPSDFGTRSNPPSHPELLDDLACEFIGDGWSVKRLIRRIVLSRVYQQSSVPSVDHKQADPENRLLWHMPRRRLDLEAMRDSILSVSGRLDRTMGGPSVSITDESSSPRRSVYAFIERQNLPGFFRTFDLAGPDTHAPQRFETTVPQQALFLLNSPFVFAQLEALVQRPEIAAAGDPAERVGRLYRVICARDPQEEERAMGVEFVAAAERTTTMMVSPWQYGYGQFDASAGRLVEFHPLPHFGGDSWRGGPEMPDPTLGWVMLSAAGGHPGNDSQHAAARRWTADRAGTLSIAGVVTHDSDEGDGIEALVVSSQQGVVARATVHHSRAEMTAGPIEVQPGDTLDLIADCRSGPGWDGFGWQATLQVESPQGSRQWESAAGFHGPMPPPLGAWQRYAQVLLLTNEFLFVD